MATKDSSMGLTVKGLIFATYTDMEKCKAYLALSLFEAATLDGQIIIQSENAKDKINTFLGRTVDFSDLELSQTQFVGIVDSASQLTACLVQKNPQAAAMNYTEDTITDCEEAYKTLTNWAIKNGVELPDEETKPERLMTELIYITNDPTQVI